MRKVCGTLEDCKNAVMLLLGKDVTVRHNKGRNKIAVYSGIVTEAYGGVFVIKTEKTGVDRMSFSYKDILCGDIRLKEGHQGLATQ